MSIYSLLFLGDGEKKINYLIINTLNAVDQYNNTCTLHNITEFLYKIGLTGIYQKDLCVSFKI